MTLHRAHLADLDELALQVREPTSRTYILEAIADYRAGSYRSAIVATWTAICFDIVAKFRELAAQGDPVATMFVTAVDKAIAQPRNPEAFLAIERQLLDEAGSAGFISHREQMDLERTKEDRNFCAHPAFIADAALFQPSPDQARAHIVHAIEHLLRHPPVEGKTALDRFVSELKGTSFPPTDAAVEGWLKARYAGQVKPATMRSIVMIAIKSVISQTSDLIRIRALSVLRALSRTEHQTYSGTLKDQLARLLASYDDRSLPRLATIIAQDRGILTWLGADVIARMQGGLTSLVMDSSENRCLFAVADLPDFSEMARQRFGQLDASEQMAVLSEQPARIFVPAAIAAFGSAGSYRGAEALGRRVASLAAMLEPADIASVLKSAAENSEIWDASGTPQILLGLFDDTLRHIKATGPMWVEFLVQMAASHRESSFAELRDRVIAQGFVVPPAPPA